MTTERHHGDLSGKAVLVVEDEYFLAKEMADAVRQAGGSVLGPVPDVAGATAILGERMPDAAILDIHLGEENSFALAATLKARGVPMIFVSGYDEWFLPEELRSVPICRKPAHADAAVRLLLQGGRTSR